jgi:glutathione S-transferase
MAEIILHHYWTSPFSEKVRLYLGLKGLAWRSVEIPNMAPKPDLTPLTGGYRRTPVLQIGADIYCDSQIILRTLEARFPDPPLAQGLDFGLGFWSDRPFFQAAVPLIFGEIGPMVPEAFKKDREAMFPDRPFDYAAMKALAPHFRDQWRAHAAMIAEGLADGRAFLAGARAGLADLHAHMNVWFLKSFLAPAADPLLIEFPAVSAWFARLAAVGHGTFSAMEASEALAIALAATSNTPEAIDPHEPNGRKSGDRVRVTPEDYGRDPVEGVLVASSAHHIAIARSAPECGDVVVHFPRAGFVVTPV